MNYYLTKNQSKNKNNKKRKNQNKETIKKVSKRYKSDIELGEL